MNSPLKAVLLQDFNPNQLEPFIKALSLHYKLAFHDAAQMARHSWGFAGENLDDAQADALLTILNSQNLPAFIVPMDALLSFPQPKGLRNFTCSKDLITVTALGEQPKEFACESLKLIATCFYRLTTEKIVKKETGPSSQEKLIKTSILLTTGIPLPSGGKKTIEIKTTSAELIFFVDLYLGTPLQRIRVEGNTLNYSFLKDRLQSTSFANFRLLIEDLNTHTPTARQNHGTTLFLKNGQSTLMKYDSPADLDKESRRLVALP